MDGIARVGQNLLCTVDVGALEATHHRHGDAQLSISAVDSYCKFFDFSNFQLRKNFQKIFKEILEKFSRNFFSKVVKKLTSGDNFAIDNAAKDVHQDGLDPWVGGDNAEGLVDALLLNSTAQV